MTFDLIALVVMHALQESIIVLSAFIIWLALPAGIWAFRNRNHNILVILPLWRFAISTFAVPLACFLAFVPNVAFGTLTYFNMEPPRLPILTVMSLAAIYALLVFTKSKAAALRAAVAANSESPWALEEWMSKRYLLGINSIILVAALILSTAETIWLK